MPALASWPRREGKIKGKMEGKGLPPQAAASSKEQPVPVARKDPSQQCLTSRTTSTQRRELGASVGRVHELPCVQESWWERSVEVPATCSWVGEGRAAGTVEEQGAEAERGLGVLKVSRGCQEVG